MSQKLSPQSTQRNAEERQIIIRVRYATKVRRYLGPGWYQHIEKEVEVSPLRIFRRPCGIGASANRYYYEVIFSDPGDAEYVRNGEVTANINRKTNPKFNPKKLNWCENIAKVSGDEL